jgi:hypothetical protein
VLVHHDLFGTSIGHLIGLAGEFPDASAVDELAK